MNLVVVTGKSLIWKWNDLVVDLLPLSEVSKEG